MSHFPLVLPGEAQDPVAQRVFGEIEQELGFGIVPNVFLAMASAPWYLEASWGQFRAIVLHGRLPRILKEMVGVVVSTVHESPYARLVHLHSLGVQGVSDDVLRALTEGAVEVEGLSPTTTAVLRFAGDAARAPRTEGASGIERLRAAGMDDAEIFEVLATIQLFSSVNLFTDLADVEIDQV